MKHNNHRSYYCVYQEQPWYRTDGFFLLMIIAGMVALIVVASLCITRKASNNKNMICASADEFEQLMYEFDSMRDYYIKPNQGVKQMEKLNCMFPGVQPVQVLEPCDTEIVKDGMNTTIFEKFTEGVGVDATGASIEVKVFIRKTVTIVNGNSTTISKFKAFAKWSERATATYVSYNSPLAEHSVR